MILVTDAGLKLEATGSMMFAGYLLRDNDVVILEGVTRLGYGTSNQGEARAVLNGLFMCHDWWPSITEIQSDSQLIMRQLTPTGIPMKPYVYGCKDTSLYPIVWMCRQLLETLNIKPVWRRREDPWVDRVDQLVRSHIKSWYTKRKETP